MSTRLDLVLQKFPAHEEGIRLLAERDPSGNLKYLDWGAKMLAAEQALAPEIADVLDLFHRYGGRAHRVDHIRRRPRHDWIRPDLYTYRPQDFAALRTALFKIQRAQDKKRRDREKLYRIEGSIEAAVVYDSDDLIVRHIQNKQASVHYGGSTKWCISMLREGYFEDYEAHNCLCAISTGKKATDPDRMIYPKDVFFKSSDQMRQLFSQWPQACDNTLAIAQRCNVEIDLKSTFPIMDLAGRPSSLSALTALRFFDSTSSTQGGGWV
jgi:hypothetical protein